MPDVTGRLRAASSALIAGVLLVGLAGPATTRAVDPPNLDRFMAALAAVESNGRYGAVNGTSGALGKYQIMPANWAAWSRRYLGDAGAAPTPANQEEVARRKLTALYGWLGDWGSVAHWWLTGDGDTNPDHWSEFSRRYVNKVLAGMGEPVPSIVNDAPASPPEPAAPTRVFDETSFAIDFFPSRSIAARSR